MPGNDGADAAQERDQRPAENAGNQADDRHGAGLSNDNVHHELLEKGGQPKAGVARLSQSRRAKGVPFAAKRRCGAGFAGGTGSNRRSCGQGMVGHAGRDASCSSLAFGGADRAPCGSAGSSRAGAMWRLRCATGANAPPRADVAYLHRAGLLSVACSRRVFTGCHCHCCRCRCRESENRRVACVGYATTAVAAGPLRPRSAPSMCPARHATSIKDRT